MFVQQNTIQALFNYVKVKLTGVFSESEIRSSFKILICKRFDWSDTDYMLNQEFRLSESDLLFIRNCTNRLLKNEPFQYIVGETEFFGLKISCDPVALIPRPETEEMVAEILNTFKHKESLAIADLCTGTGCIGIALAKNFNSSEVVLTDISAGALELAKSNAQLNNATVNLIEHDVLAASAFVNWKSESFDIWVSNPPYIPLSDKNQMDETVLSHEPHLALFVEDSNPLIFYQVILKEAKVFLKKNGWLFFEIHPDFSTDLVSLFQEYGFVNIELMKDLQGRTRMLKGQNV
jgi:release factor glutamine methyltransferase